MFSKPSYIQKKKKKTASKRKEWDEKQKNKVNWFT